MRPVDTSIRPVSNINVFDPNLQPSETVEESDTEMFQIIEEKRHSQPILRQGGGQCGDC